MGGGRAEHHKKKKIKEHRITAKKVNETPSPSHTVRFEITATLQIDHIRILSIGLELACNGG